MGSLVMNDGMSDTKDNNHHFVFEALQSIGAAGFAASTKTGVAAVTTGLGGVVGSMWSDQSRAGSNEKSSKGPDQSSLSKL